MTTLHKTAEWARSKIIEANPDAVLIEGMGAALTGFVELPTRRIAIYNRRLLFDELLAKGLTPQEVVETVITWEQTNFGPHGPVISDVWESLDEQLES